MPKIAVIPGDGIGPEVVGQGVKIIEHFKQESGLDLEMEEFDFGAEHYLETGETIPEQALAELEAFDAIYLGAVGDPRVKPGVLEAGILLKLRFHFDQYINLRPIKLLRNDFSPLKGKGTEEIDFTVIRENTEGLYAGIGGFFKKDTPDEVASQEMIATRKGVDRVLKYAFEYTRDKDRRQKLTLVDKSNVLTYAHDLWQRAFAEMKGDYPGVETDHFLVDAVTMKMVRNPEVFDVIVTCNMFGDIITDLGAELQGGMGLAVSGNINPDRVSMFEPVHGSAPDIAGENRANPLASILAASMMLDYLGYQQQGKLVEQAVSQTIEENQLTPDMGGELTTDDVGDHIVDLIKNMKGRG
ncbi:MAG: 3-isopropylmalate dehydrogenase [Bacillota bacterium]